MRAEHRAYLERSFNRWRAQRGDSDDLGFINQPNNQQFITWAKQNGGLLFLAEETSREIHLALLAVLDPEYQEYKDYDPYEDLKNLFHSNLNPDLELRKPEYFTCELLEQRGFTKLAGWIRKKYGTVKNFVKALPEDNTELGKIRGWFGLVDRDPAIEAQKRR